MATKYVENRIREARLIVSRPERVFDELQRYGDEAKSAFWEQDERLETSLLTRKEPLIDLGLAHFARSTKVLSILYKKASLTPKDRAEERYLRGLKIALLSNEVEEIGFTTFPENVVGKEEFVRIVATDDEEILSALLTNPVLDYRFIVSLYKNDGPAASLPDDRRRRLVHMTSDNPRLVTDKSNEHGPDLGYMDIHKGVITMLATAPVTEHWLVTLRTLIDQLDPSGVWSPDGPITSTLERWAQLPESENKFQRDGYFTNLSLRDETLCLIAAMYGRHYSKDNGGQSGPVILGKPDASDIVLRCAYYGKATLTEKEMKAGFARDEDVYVLAILCNDHVYYTPTLRKLLEDEQLRGDLRHTYRRRCEQIHRRRPWFDPRPVSEWLIEEQHEELPAPSNKITMLGQLEAKIAEVAKNVTSMQTWVVWGFIIVGALVIYTRQ